MLCATGPCVGASFAPRSLNIQHWNNQPSSTFNQICKRYCFLRFYPTLLHAPHNKNVAIIAMLFKCISIHAECKTWSNV